jgi:hypothetical protein
LDYLRDEVRDRWKGGAAMMACPHCGNTVKDGANFCIECGKALVRKGMICTRCGTIREQAAHVKDGSGCFEVVLWLCGILPGLVYHIWRSNTIRKVCPSCLSTEIIGLSSPRGQKLLREQEAQRQ